MTIQEMPGHLIRRLNQLSTLIFAKRMQEAGLDLTSVQFAAMDAIIAKPGIDQAGIAAAIAYDRATIGGVIDRLEQKGLIMRVTSLRDRRAKEVRPTELGRNIYTQIQPIVADLQSDILGGLSETEQAQFVELAGKIIGNAEPKPSQATPEPGT